jgi:hypothetical protein
MGLTGHCPGRRPHLHLDELRNLAPLLGQLAAPVDGVLIAQPASG